MPNVTLNLDVYCSECGDGICNHADFNKYKGALEVRPCDYCMNQKQQEIDELNDEIDRLNELLDEEKA
jgi:hypothetical protein